MYGPAPGYAPPGQAPPYGGQPANPSAPPPTNAPPAAPLPPVLNDPVNNVDVNFLRGQAQVVLRELTLALSPANAQRVQGIPLVVEDKPGEVNAFAACSGGRALMAISDGLLDIEAHLAQAKAYDELFGTRKVDEYIQFLARNQRPGQPIVRPPPGFFDPARAVDGRKVQRQNQLLNEQIAFVMGHELAHHYLGHLPCTAGGLFSPADIARVLSNVVPVFNQPNELAADVAGTDNVLKVNARHPEYGWNEEGGLLTMQFFSGLDRASPVDILFDFERTHPPPGVRVPVIQQAAATWRSTGGRIPMPGL